MSITSIPSLSLDALVTVTGGKARSKTTKAKPTAAAPAEEKPNLGGAILKGCFSGAGGAIKQGVSAEDLAVGCATGAGKSVLEGLGKMFGK